jgi:hypothetical protein
MIAEAGKGQKEKDRRRGTARGAQRARADMLHECYISVTVVLPRSAPMPAAIHEYVSESVLATTRAAKVEALKSCCKQGCYKGVTRVLQECDSVTRRIN